MCASCAYLNKLAAEQEARDAGKPRVGICVTGGDVAGTPDVSQQIQSSNGLKGLGSTMGNVMAQGAVKGAFQSSVSAPISSGLRNSGQFVPKSIYHGTMKQYGYSPGVPFGGEQAKAAGSALGVDYLCLIDISDVNNQHYTVDIQVVDAVDGSILGRLGTEGYQNNIPGSMLTMQNVAREVVSAISQADAPRAEDRARVAAEEARLAAEAEAQKAAEEAEAQNAVEEPAEPAQEPAAETAQEPADVALEPVEAAQVSTVEARESAAEAEAAPKPSPDPNVPPADSVKPRMAVYVTGTGDVELEAMRVIVGSALAKAVKDAGKYSAKNLPFSVLNQHGFTLDGSASGKQVTAVGKEFGVQYMCIVETGGASGGSLNLNARLADAATGETAASAAAHVADMEDVGQIMHAAQKIAQELSRYEARPAVSGKAVSAAAVEPVKAARDTTPTPVSAVTGGADAIEMAFVRGGTFTMGCTAEQSDRCFGNEKPARIVTLNNFYIGKYEITQKQWVEVMGTNPSHFKGDNLPVENITWFEAQEFISKLDSRTGKKYRLPTEAEWEYAARGGAGSRFYMYAGSNNIDDVAWYDDNSDGKTQQIGGKAPNELGLYDMSGNVNEWVSDWLGPYGSSGEMNPAGPGYGNYRVIRGGIWSDGARYCRVSSRISAGPDFKGGNLGFRLALSADTALELAGGAQARPATPAAAMPAYVPRDRPFITVYVRGGIEDGEVKAALASELLFDLVNSGLYRPVEDGHAFAAAADKAVAEHGASGLNDGQIARIGSGAKADLVCVVDATPVYDEFQVSARLIDVNSAVVLKMGVVDGKITNAEEFSAMEEKVVIALIGEAAYRGQPEPAPPAQEPAYAPAQAASPAPDEEWYDSPREEQSISPEKRKARVSVGTGGFYAGGYGGGIGWPSGARVAMPYSGGGWYAFFDGEYVELVFGYYSGGGKWVSAAASDSRKLPDMQRSGVNFGAFVKFPFGEESARGFPLFGIEYEASSSGGLTYEYSAAGYSSLDGGDMSALWFKLGGGLDINLGERFYLRSELLFGWRTANEYEQDAVRTEKTYGNNAKTIIGSGLSLKIGVGCKI